MTKRTTQSAEEPGMPGCVASERASDPIARSVLHHAGSADDLDSCDLPRVASPERDRMPHRQILAGASMPKAHPATEWVRLTATALIVWAILAGGSLAQPTN